MDEERAFLFKAALDAIEQDPELVRVSQGVEEAFRQATARPHYKSGKRRRLWTVPNAAGCRMVALYLMALHQNTKRPKTKVVVFGKAFLRHLKAERRDIEWWVCHASAPQVRVVACWLPGKQELLDRIDQTIQNIEWMLPRLETHNSYREPIRQIAACARQAWEDTNNERAPSSKKPDAPLCLFVVAALRLIKQERAAELVSAVLRGRRRK